MPSCPSAQCSLSLQDKFFNSVEELMTHANAARGSHPLCIECQRVFKDRPSYIQHNDTKHTIYCEKCDRKYHSQTALDQHYRASAAHPKCRRCSVGVRDKDALAVHMADEHPRVKCCGLSMFKDELDKHYLNSSNHPHCEQCFIGFVNSIKLVEHELAKHTEQDQEPEQIPAARCDICDIAFTSMDHLNDHNSDPGVHSSCGICHQIFKDTPTKIEHFTTTHVPQESDSMSSSSVSPNKVGSWRRQSLPPSSNAISQHAYRHPNALPDQTSNVPSRSATLDTPKGSAASSTHPWIAASRIESRILSDTSYSSQTSSSVTSPNAPISAMNRTRMASPKSADFSNDNSDAHTSLWSGFKMVDRNRAMNADSAGSPQPSNAWIHQSKVEGNGFIPDYVATPSAFNTSSRDRMPPPPPLTTLSSTTSAMHTPIKSHPLSPSEPSSSHSRISFAETPSGDLSNFHLLNGGTDGSPTGSTDRWKRGDLKDLESAVEMDVFSVSTPSPPPGSMTPQSTLPMPRSRASLSLVTPVQAMPTNGGIQSKFHCRLCALDPCNETTATACGHIFCNRCIVEEVRRNARCPICHAVILLFALLKLDLVA